MNAQAEAMQGLVGQLQSFVTGQAQPQPVANSATTRRRPGQLLAASPAELHSRTIVMKRTRPLANHCNLPRNRAGWRLPKLLSGVRHVVPPQTFGP